MDAAPAKKKKRPNRQHTVRGASWIQFARELRSNAVSALDSKQIIELIASAAEAEGKRVRHLR